MEKITKAEFNIYIRPHLIVSDHRPNQKVSYFKIFTYVLQWMQRECNWSDLKIRDKEIAWKTVYYHYNKWCKNDSIKRLLDNKVIDRSGNLKWRLNQQVSPEEKVNS